MRRTYAPLRTWPQKDQTSEKRCGRGQRSGRQYSEFIQAKGIHAEFTDTLKGEDIIKQVAEANSINCANPHSSS